MIKNLLIILFCCCVMQNASAQRMKGAIKRKTAEAAFSYQNGVYDGKYWAVGASTHYMWGIGRNRQRFSIGMGLRQFNFFGKQREYQTSDQTLVSQLKGGTDSLYFDKINSIMLNSYLALQIHIKRGIDFGLNLDLGGITFGGTKQAYFHSYELTNTELRKVLTQPFAFNFNPVPMAWKGGYGSSCNEAYFQFNGGKIMRYRLGFNYFVNETNTKTPQTGNGTRFKAENYLVTGAIVWNLRHNQARYDLWNMNK
jgi:hypothetical protein